MATGFSKYDAVDKKKSFNDSSTNPTRIDGEKYFDKVILKWNDGDCDPAEETSPAECTPLSFVEKDEKLNFLSLTVLGLRALFLKSVVFNVIMTLYMWIS
ncbi:T cell receptor alpha chain constant region-like [Arapaima gigas]